MKSFTANQLMKETKSFLVVRALVYLLVMLAMIVAGSIGLLLCWVLMKNNLMFLAMVIFGLTFGSFFGLLKFAKKYFLYMVKVAHVAAITELIKTGTVPVTEKGYRGVVAYGTEKIKNNFGATNIAFVADNLIHGATKQIMKWMNKAQKLLSFIPNADKVMNFINLILSTALNFIDEAILSYIFYKDEEANSFKKSCDALVYYAQSWKSMLLGALKVAVFVWVLRIVVFLIFTGIFYIIANATAGVGGLSTIIALIFAFILLYGVETIIVVPYATCIMINDYHKAIDGLPLKADLYGTLCKVSGKFKELFSRSNQPLPEEPKEIPASF